MDAAGRRRLYEQLAADLEPIARRFKNPRITLIVRSPDLADGDILLTDDNVEDAIAAVRRLQSRPDTLVVQGDATVFGVPTGLPN